MKPKYLFSLVTLSLCAAAVLLSSQAQSEEQQTAKPQEGQIAKLLNERRMTARKFVEAANSEYQVGIKTLEHVILAQNELLDAELELAKTHAARIQIYEQRLNNLQKLEQQVDGKRKLGAKGGSEAEFLAAKLARLKAEVALHREQQAK